MGWGRRENEKEARPLEEPIYFKGWENHSNQNLYGKHASVSDVFIPYAHFCGKKIRKIAKRLFVGGGGHMERKAHLVKWEVVCGDKVNGGLGIRKFTIMNEALLGKWTWRFASDKEALWKQVLVAKYGQED